MLIRDGAVLVRGTQDILDHIGAQPTEQIAMELPLPDRQIELPHQLPETRSLRETNLLHQDILARLGPNPIAEDQLIRALGAAPCTVAPLLVDLELEGKVIRQAGGLLARAV